MITSNLGHFVLECTKNYRELPSFVLKEANGSRRPLSFFEFSETVLKISHIFRTRYPNPGFKIGLLGENRVEWCGLALGIWHAGGTLVPLMHIATDTEIANVVTAAKLDALFISPRLHKTTNFGVRDTFGMDFVQSRGGGDYKTLGDLLSELRSSPLPTKHLGEIRTKPDDTAVLIFTSGTTGHPKGVMLSHRNIITNILDTIDMIPMSRTDRAVSVLPLSHMFELVGGFTIVHLKGICISYPDSLKSEDVLSEMKIHKATMLVAVPLFFEIIDRSIHEKIKRLPSYVQNAFKNIAPAVKRYPFLGKLIFKKVHEIFGGHVRFFVSGGAKIDPDIVERFRALGIQVLQGYGLTETSPIISFTGIRAHRYGSVGQIVPSIRLRVNDPNDKGEGEICVSGPSVFKGYFENPEATAQVVREGWFHTGDIGRVDEEGFLFITGRMKDMIVTPNGKNVYPEELEECLRMSPLFNEVAVLGLDTGRGEEVHAVIVPSAQAPVDATAQKEAIWKELERLGGQLSDYKHVQSITITTAELPRTATKKVKKHLLKEMIKKGELGDGALTSSAVGAQNGNVQHTPLNKDLDREVWLNDRLQQITKKPEIWKEAHLRRDLGIDSLTFMELISGIESHWGVQFADEDFEKIFTVEDLLKKLGEAPAVTVDSSGVSVAANFDYHKNNTILMNGLRVLAHVTFIRPFLRVLFHFKVINAQILWQNKNVVITPNHSSHIDVVSVLASVPLSQVNRTYAVAADDYFFDKWLKAFFVRLLFNAIPFDRKARIEKGFKVCEEILKEGGSLVIFPEGTRSPNGQLSRFKSGVGRLLASTGYSGVPIYILGAFDIFPKGSKFPQLKPLTVFIGKPQNFLPQPAESRGYQAVAEKLQVAVEELREQARVQTLK